LQLDQRVRERQRVTQVVVWSGAESVSHGSGDGVYPL
jgi:hypothetical protein